MVGQSMRAAHAGTGADYSARDPGSIPTKPRLATAALRLPPCPRRRGPNAKVKPEPAAFGEMPKGRCRSWFDRRSARHALQQRRRAWPRARSPPACLAGRPRWACSASSRRTAFTTPISTATRRCRSWSASPGRASPCMKVRCRATRPRTAASGMTHDFAARLWPMTKLGVRVIVARNEVTPVDFAHPALFSPKPSRPERRSPTDDPGKHAEAAAPVRLAQADAPPSTGAGTRRPPRRLMPAPSPAVPRRAPRPSPIRRSLRPSRRCRACRRRCAPRSKTDSDRGQPSTADRSRCSSVARRRSSTCARASFRCLTSRSRSIIPSSAFGTHVFTAMGFIDDGAAMRWNLMTMPGEQPRVLVSTSGRAESRHRRSRASRRRPPRRSSIASKFRRRPWTGSARSSIRVPRWWCPIQGRRRDRRRAPTSSCWRAEPGQDSPRLRGGHC